ASRLKLAVQPTLHSTPVEGRLPSSQHGAVRWSDASRWYGPAVAIVFLAAHLPLLPRTLDDVDAMNFALGLRLFDPAHHQPHPPGYPIFMLLGKMSLAFVHNEAVALAFWGAVAG